MALQLRLPLSINEVNDAAVECSFRFLTIAFFHCIIKILHIELYCHKEIMALLNLRLLPKPPVGHNDGKYRIEKTNILIVVYTVHDAYYSHIVYTIQYTDYTLHGVLYNVYCVLYSVVYIVCVLYTVCIVCSMQCALSSILGTMR